MERKKKKLGELQYFLSFSPRGTMAVRHYGMVRKCIADYTNRRGARLLQYF